MSDPVLHWAPDAAAASAAVGGVVPASVLLGLTRIESGGREGLTSSTGAGGLTQFMPATARSYGVDVSPGHAGSQLLGAAKYLVALGFEDDPAHALAAYNGGPGNADIPETRAYATHVLVAARAYAGLDRAGAAVVSPSAGGAADAASSSGLVSPAQHSSLVRFGLTAGLVIAAVALIVVGVGRATGVRSPLASAAGAAS